MSTPKLILTILLLVVDVILAGVVLLQEGKTAGLSGAIAGGADTFLSKNKAKTLDAKLARWTKWVAVSFVVLCLAISLL